MKVNKLNEETIKAPKVYFTREAFAKLAGVINKKNTDSKEIAYFGQVRRLGKKLFEIHNIIIPPQEKNTSSWVETHDDMAEWIAKEFNDIQERRSIRMHGHTHPTFKTGPSGTDQQLYKELKDTVSDFFIRVIFNEDMEFNADIFDYVTGYEWLGIPLHIKLNDKFDLRSAGTGNYKVIVNPKFKGRPQVTNDGFLQWEQENFSIFYDTGYGFAYVYDNLFEFEGGKLKSVHDQIIEVMGKELKAVQKVATVTRTTTTPTTQTGKSYAYTIKKTIAHVINSVSYRITVYTQQWNNERVYFKELGGFVSKTMEGPAKNYIETILKKQTNTTKGSEDNTLNIVGLDADLLPIIDLLEGSEYDLIREGNKVYYTDPQTKAKELIVPSEWSIN